MKEKEIIEKIVNELERSKTNLFNQVLLFYELFHFLGKIDVNLYKVLFAKTVGCYLNDEDTNYSYDKLNNIITIKSQKNKLELSFDINKKGFMLHDFNYFPVNEVLYESEEDLSLKDQLLGLNNISYFFSYHNPNTINIDKNGYRKTETIFYENGRSVSFDTINLKKNLLKEKEDNMIVYDYLRNQINTLKNSIKIGIDKEDIKEDIYYQVSILENYLMLIDFYQNEIELLEIEMSDENRSIVSQVVVEEEKIKERYHMVVKNDKLTRRRKKNE